jgi:predicted DNA-binding protein
MRRTNIFLPDQLLAKLAALSKATGLSMAEHVRRAILEYLRRQK